MSRPAKAGALQRAETKGRHPSDCKSCFATLFVPVHRNRKMHTEEERRAYSWQMMLACAGRHDAQRNPKSHESTWRADQAVRDLRNADAVVRSPFNRLRHQD